MNSNTFNSNTLNSNTLNNNPLNKKTVAPRVQASLVSALLVLALLVLALILGTLVGVKFFQVSEVDHTGARQAGSLGAGAMPQAAPPHAGPGDDAGGSSFSFAGFMSAMRPGAASAQLQADFSAALRKPQGEALQRAFTRWLLAAPDDAMAHIASIPAEERKLVITTALAELAHKQPSAFKRMMSSQAAVHLGDVIGLIAEKNPALALTMLMQYKDQNAAGALTAAVLPALIRHDMALAAKTVAAMKERAPLALIQQVAAAYAQQNPALAYEWASHMVQHNANVTPSQLADQVSSSLAAGNPNAAVDFMDSTADPAIRRSLMSEIAIRKGQDDLAAAWQWLDQYSADPAFAEAAQNLLYRWSYTKPQEVAQLLPGVHNLSVQANAAAHLTRFWKQRDQAAYQSWIASLPPGQLRSLALAAL